jgi:hypothetical protein
LHFCIHEPPTLRVAISSLEAQIGRVLGSRLQARFGVFVVAFVLGLHAKLGLAFAQEPNSPSSTHDSAVARALFREGVACADVLDWECAADRFARAREVRPSPVLTYNLGQALIELGRFVEGTEILTQLLRDSTLQSSVRADAERTLELASQRIGQLSIHVIGPIDGVVFTLDGHELAASLLETTIPVDPGERLIEAHRSNELIAHARVLATSGQPTVATLTLPELPSLSLDAPTAAPAPEVTASSFAIEPRSFAIEPRDEPRSDDAPWIALGIGGAVAVIGGAIVLGIVLSQPSSDPTFEGNLGHVEIGPGR